jgi:hypothetical protein
MSDPLNSLIANSYNRPFYNLNRKFLWGISFLLIFGLLFTGCSYHLVKPDPKIVSPILISVEPFRNRTLYPELDWKVTDLIIMELINWPWVKICHCDKVDYVLSGEVLSYRSQIPYTYDSAQNPIEYKLIIEMSLSYQGKEKGSFSISSTDKEGQIEAPENTKQVIPRLQEEEIYHLGSYDLGDSKRAELEALKRAIKRMTRRAMDLFMGMNMSCY